MAYPAGWVPLLQVDQDLAARLTPATVAEAAPLAFAATEWLGPGEWRPRAPAPEERSAHLGLLVVDGFLARRVDVLERPVTELLGRGDLLLPWEPDQTDPFASGMRWEVLEEVRVAILDHRFTALLGRWPDLTAALVGRAVSRSRQLRPEPRDQPARRDRPARAGDAVAHRRTGGGTRAPTVCASPST